MCNDRNTAAEQILKTIEYGLLPVAEIERRLEQIISEALAGPIGAEYDNVSPSHARNIYVLMALGAAGVACGTMIRRKKEED